MARSFTAFERDPISVARALLGQRLVRRIDGERLAGIIVEVEAYLGAEDRAAHTFGGRRTARNESMYLPGGHAYVYFTYGMHHCLNIVCGKRDDGVAVLLRALEPTEGIELMYRLRPMAKRDRDLCSGPAKLTQALAIDRSLDGADLREGKGECALAIERATPRAIPPSHIVAAPRVGVGYAGRWATRKLRFYVRGCPYISRT